ncbi:histidine protein methyltransferase 1 homolog [Gigantopelta aegis]|uniref:histidine protein methyltransferase 1 homolog n=1 Tax=Gigantopelta aegis TaxID=1735272 RepID=UPI001B88E40C|nr:histidine protein methyltransferase 1 homolog [Gigantopelta aegis]
MAFKFNFQSHSKSITVEDEDDELTAKTSKEITLDVPTESRTRRNSIEIQPKDHKTHLPHEVKTIKQEFQGVKLTVIEQRSLEIYLTKQDFGELDILEAVSWHVDLAPGVYEGGFKVWECGVDLANFLCDQCIEIAGKRVLELGCGAGLPGLCAMKKDAKAVHFQDYNSEVIEYLTVKNVLLNNKDKCECRFFSGDWSTLVNAISPNNPKPCSYDIILTAETIYNPECYEMLSKVLDALLAPDGVIYVSAKCNYFGVGGGTRLFEDHLTAAGRFTSEVYHRITANVPREILKIVRKT